MARPYRLPPEIADFARRYRALLSEAIANRMRRIGVPSDMIGIEYWGVDTGAFVEYFPPQLGGNIRVGLNGRTGINVDPAIFDFDAPKVGQLSAWRGARLRDRVDAVVAHEFTEATAPEGCDFHQYAIEHAERTELEITDRARLILEQYRLSEEGRRT